MPARVLIVDDVPANLRLLEAQLTAEYFEVVAASNGEEAIDACLRSSCDIVLLDVMMPGMNGFEVCRRLKSDPRTYHIPIVMVSALDQPADRVAGLEAGADDFLTKPYSEVALLSRVRSLSRMKQMTDDLHLRAVSSREIDVAGIWGAAILDDGLRGRILIVDDRASSYERMKAALDQDHHVEIETSPQEAVFRAAEVSYDLLIVSLGFANYDGLRLCSQTRSLERTRYLPILAVTEPEDSARMVRGLDLGINDFLTRPIDRAELIARVKTQIRRKRYSERLRASVQVSVEMAVMDPLTGMHNRRYMERQLEQLFDAEPVPQRPLSVVMIDIDHFKAINDTYGHDCGDEVLREFANRVRKSTRGIDITCRYGGEEFVIVMPDADLGVARNVGERLRRKIMQEPFIVGRAKASLDVTISVGISARQAADTPASVIKRADVALYQAKSDGRNRVVSDAA
ncbi:PleD family two-component system response regulator [Terrihabitans sp. B22-R8]|uniref:PleD family two-component system response regulator n=1 Tax=Terrihabitans sp. B22-R8 TaxID=3425128 RepID=UPI00403C065A